MVDNISLETEVWPEDVNYFRNTNVKFRACTGLALGKKITWAHGEKCV